MKKSVIQVKQSIDNLFNLSNVSVAEYFNFSFNSFTDINKLFLSFLPLAVSSQIYFLIVFFNFIICSRDVKECIRDLLPFVYIYNHFQTHFQCLMFGCEINFRRAVSNPCQDMSFLRRPNLCVSSQNCNKYCSLVLLQK